MASKGDAARTPDGEGADGEDAGDAAVMEGSI